MRTSLVFLAFFCAIVVIDGAIQLQQAQPATQQGGQQGGQGGQQGGQIVQGPIDCFKFNSDSHLSNDKDCLPTTTVLRNDTYWAFCDSTLDKGSSQGSSSQGSSIQGSSIQSSTTQGSSIQGSSIQGSSIQGTFARPIMYCMVDAQSILTCWSKDKGIGGGPSGAQGTQAGAQGTQAGGQGGSQGMSSNQADVVGKTFSGCFLYQTTELNQQGTQGTQGEENEDEIEYICVRRKPNQMATGIAGSP
jgi:hypothetical protein